MTKTNTTPSLNTILYGPPGTGKTFHTVERAVNIINPSFSGTREQYKDEYDRLVAAKQIRFVTFHQSFSYEDFVEGIRPETGKNDTLTYPVQDGIFKEIVIDAQSSRCSNPNDNVQYNPKNIWKMSLGDTQGADAYIYDECIKNNYILLGYGYDIDFTACKSRKEILEKFKSLGYQGDDLKYPVTATNIFTNKMQIGDLVIISDGNFKFRAIGRITGDYEFIENDERNTYRQCRSVEWLKIFDISLPRQRIMDVNFSQMTLYKPNPSALDKNKLFGLLQDEADNENYENEQFVLIIDEINRGNISRIFGELITLLEDDKREGTANAQSIILPYSKDPFIIPKNLHILGTMNTADRSLAGIDIALRRRFQFEEMMPKPDLLANIQIDGINLAEVLAVMNERIEVLLGRDYVIGHSYFIKLKSNDNLEQSGLPDIFINKIIPLLQEYFYEDWERIQWVLNDHRKNNISHKFIRKYSDSGEGRNFQDLFGAELDLPETTDKRWTINHEAFANSQSYVQIYATASKPKLNAVPLNAE